MFIQDLFTCLLSISNVFLAMLVMRYCMHMFQQCGYKTSESLLWLKDNRNKTYALAVSIIFDILYFALPNVIFAILGLSFKCLVLYYFYFLNYRHVRKKLVWTARAKRLSASDAVLTCLVLLLAFGIAGPAAACIACTTISLLQFPLIVLASKINSPIEHAINERYIEEARSILKEHPDLIVIGITGSYGKTSVKEYLYSILNDDYEVLATPGNYNTLLGVVKTIREELKPYHKIFVCEMGARYPGDIKEICDLVEPDYGVITSIGEQHLMTFGSLDAIAATKFELFDSVASNGGKMIVNADDINITSELAKRDSSPVIPLTRLEASGGYKLFQEATKRTGTSFTIESHKNEQLFFTHLVGSHNIFNLGLAIAAANVIGMDLDRMRVAVRRMKGVPHRLELKNINDMVVLDDAYNSNPIGSKVAIETVNGMKGCKILVTPGMIELGAEQDKLNYQFAQYAAPVFNKVAIVNKTNKDAIYKGLIDGGFPTGSIEYFDHMDQALKWAYGLQEKSKIVLIENDLPDRY